LLLDEPTNHLDVATIEWLEAELQASRCAFVLISHDRAFVRALTRATLWLDRGEVRRRDGAFDGFEDWRDEVWAAEDAARHKLDRKIKAEARWAVEGISARRKRNMGRVRALAALRADRAAQIRRQGTAAMSFESAGPSGARVIEVEALSKRFGATEIARNLSFRVMRGDRVAIVGPNGAGKTTLLRTILGDEAPDQGRITLGTGLEIAVYDQARAALDPDATLWETLTKDPALGVSGNGDQVMVRGQPRHVVGYLKDFLFDDAQARAPVRSLSGGERARLLLARLMAQPANLLVLDEPTNDLDVETLDLLQDILAEFPGTVVFVSHDRDFIDRVATLTIAMEGGGTVRAYPGGWSDYVAQRGPRAAPPTVRTAAMQAPRTAAAPPPPAPGTKGLTFTEKKRFADLPDRIATLERDIAKLSDLLADPDLFARDPARFDKASRAMTERQEALRLAEDDWLSLAEKAEAGS
jgi:ABC transport system ATP-binding/permease protein